MTYKRKWKCLSCDGISFESDLLSATNPFDETVTITGCPKCKDVSGFTEICDEPDCERDASCGFPTRNGYRRTCHGHMMTDEDDFRAAVQMAEAKRRLERDAPRPEAD